MSSVRSRGSSGAFGNLHKGNIFLCCITSWEGLANFLSYSRSTCNTGNEYRLEAEWIQSTGISGFITGG